MGRPPAKDLTERELEVMHVFWPHGESTAAEARDRLAAAGLDRTYTTIANLVRALATRDSWHRSTPSGRSSIGLPGLMKTSRGDSWATWSIGSFKGSRAIALPAGRTTEAHRRGASRPRTDREGARQMNDLGMTLSWSAIQVTLVLVPAAALHALASRRGPASGAWIATLGLALPWQSKRRACSATRRDDASGMAADATQSSAVRVSMRIRKAPPAKTQSARKKRAGLPVPCFSTSIGSFMSGGASSRGRLFRLLDSGGGGVRWRFLASRGLWSGCSGSLRGYGPSACVAAGARS